MAAVTLKEVSKTYRSDRSQVAAVRAVSLEVADREFVVMVGPSGCGKSTTLRMIAGLEEVTSGTIRIGDRVVNNVAPKDRDIAMVFQNYALYPHMTVYKNMSFGLRMRKVPKKEIDQKVRQAARMLGVEHLLDRRPKQLSGGERQRVAVGRAIVRDPQAFLFDEPLSNLDARLRVQMRAELKKLHRELRSTVIYVTHDQEEAMTLGDRIVVMRDGVIHQCGAPQAVYDTPRDRFVASFVGTPPMNFFEGKLATVDGAVCFEAGGGLIRLTETLGRRLADRVGAPAILGVRPEDLTLSAPGDKDRPCCSACGTALHGEFCHCCGARREADGGRSGTSMPMRISVVEPLGDEKDVYLQTADGVQVIARVPSEADAVEGREVEVFFNVSGAHVFEPGETGLNMSVNGRGAAAGAN
jgi:multiple sugar transport system ATP-binding protein